MSIFNWFYNEDPKGLVEFADEISGQVPFYGNKVLRLDSEPDTVWYNAYKDLFETIATFLKENCSKILNWAGSEDSSGAASFFESSDAISASSAPQV